MATKQTKKASDGSDLVRLVDTTDPSDLRNAVWFSTEEAALRSWKRREGLRCHEAGKVGDALRRLVGANKKLHDPNVTEAIDCLERFIDSQPEAVQVYARMKPQPRIVRV